MTINGKERTEQETTTISSSEIMNTVIVEEDNEAIDVHNANRMDTISLEDENSTTSNDNENVDSVEANVIFTTDAAEASSNESTPEATNNTSASNNTIIEEAAEEQSKRQFYTRLLVGLVFAAFVIFVIVDSSTNMHALDALHDFLEWVEENPVSGVFAFVVVYFVATVLFIPGALLTLGSGFVFAMAFGLGAGVVLGTLAVFIGASIGATVSFLLGRYLLRRQMARYAKRSRFAIFEALDSALQRKGLRIFILLRLSPIIPFSLLNYLAGITSVSLRDYVVALFAILPGTVLYVFLGASAGSLTESATSSDSNSTITIIVTVVGCVFGILAIAITSRYAKGELNRVLEDRSSRSNNNFDDGSNVEAGRRRRRRTVGDEEANFSEVGEDDVERDNDNSNKTKKKKKNDNARRNRLMEDESITQAMDGSATEFGSGRDYHV